MTVGEKRSNVKRSKGEIVPLTLGRYFIWDTFFYFLPDELKEFHHVIIKFYKTNGCNL